jgi:hypothetical protein
MEPFYFVFATYEEACEYLPKFESDAAVKLREEAKRNREREEESFQRCDTDGFLSQWALGIGAQEREREAELADAGYMVVRPALMDIESGEIVAACVHISKSKFHYGEEFQWKVYRKNGQWNWFWCGLAKRESTYTKKGLRKVYVLAPGTMYSRSPGDNRPEGRGLSGAANYTGKHPDIDYKASGLPL